MSSMTSVVRIIGLFVAAIFVLAACGSSNGSATYDPETAAHPSDWLPAGHVAPAQKDVNWCKSCHGEDLVGGISKVSCTTCHLGGPLSVHPSTFNNLPWFQAGASTQGHGLYVISNGTSACKNMWCHGAGLEGVAQSGPACSTCHPGEAF